MFLGGTTSVKHRQNGSTYVFPQYVCDYGRRNLDCEGSLISEKNLEAFMLNSLEDELDKYNSQITLGIQKDNTDKLKRCHERLDRIKLLFEMGDMEIDVYKQKRDELLSEIESCTPTKIQKPIHLEKNWKELYNGLDAEHKNSFWKQIIDHLEVPSKKAKEVKIFFK